MDSAKVANLFACYPESDLMDFVAVPHGKGKPILKQLKPLICGEPRCVHMYVCVNVCMCVCACMCMHALVKVNRHAELIAGFVRHTKLVLYA